VQQKSYPQSTLTINIDEDLQYNPKIVKAMVQGATDVKFGHVKGKFSAIFHFDTTTPPKVNKEALGIHIMRSGQKVESRCAVAGGAVTGGGGVAAAIRVVCAPPAPAPAPNVIYDVEVLRPRIGSMYNTLNAGRNVRDACKELGYTLPLTVSIFQSGETQESHLLTARITTTGTIPLTADQIRELIYSTLCLYKRVGHVAHSL